ncbi:MAG: ribonuclease III domain-containing protein [Clostridia bacterium]
MDKYLDNIDLQIISNQTLAFIGDAIYNVYIRTYLASKSSMQTGILHKQSIKYVSAKAQSKIMDTLINELTDEEINIYKRGRNTNIVTVSKNVDVIEYKKATGFEAFLGYLYLSKNIKRLEEIVDISINIIEKC